MARETKDLSYVVAFLCQEHQLRGICLRSLVIVNSLFGAHCALKCHNNTKAYTSAQTYIIFCWLKTSLLSFFCFYFSFFFISMVAKKGLTCCKTAVQVPELSYALCVSVCVCECVRAFGVSFVNDGFAKVLRKETLVFYAFDSLLV